MEPKYIEEIWEKLAQEAGADTESQTVATRLFPESNVDLFLGYSRRTDMRLLLLALKSPENIAQSALIRTKGIEVALYHYKDLMPGTKFLAVALLLPQFTRMFALMISDIAKAVHELPDEERLRIEAVVQGIKKWQLLLEKLSPEGLSDRTRRGLFCELTFLKKYAMQVMTPDAAVSHWTGPHGSHQDFQFPECNVEIKGTISKRHELIHIASERQLDESLTPVLFLAHLQLSEGTNKGNTLPELVKEIRNHLTTNIEALTEFDGKLLNIGYHESQEELYDKIKNHVRGVSFYRVHSNFPRILESDLRNGVGDVQYSISVSSCMSYQVKEDDLIERLNGSNNAG